MPTKAIIANDRHLFWSITSALFFLSFFCFLHFADEKLDGNSYAQIDWHTVREWFPLLIWYQLSHVVPE